MFINALKIWSFKGRICRWQYLLAFFVVVLIWAFLSGTAELPEDIAKYLLFILLIPSQVRRMHDFGWSGWIIFLTYFISYFISVRLGLLIGLGLPLPLVIYYLLVLALGLMSVILGLGLFILSGTKGPNKYGYPPGARL